MKRLTVLITLLALGMGPAGTAYCSTGDDMMSVIDSMKHQMAQMQQTIQEQSEKIRRLEVRTAEAPSPTPIPGPANAAATMSDNDFQKSLKDNIGEVVPFLKGAKYYGDIRLRMENFDYFNQKQDAGATTTDRTRNRYRVRLRWGFEKDYLDDWKVGFRLATGSTTDQTSTNQTLGNSGYFNFKTINIDRVYATYSPNGLKDMGPLKGVTVGAGKFDNPFLRYSTTIVWDGDVTPEGMYEKGTFELYNTEENKVFFDTVLGQFITNENLGGPETDAGLYGYQGAFRWTTYNIDPNHPVSFAFATSYYDYTNWFQTVTANTAATSYLRTNTLIADDFRVLDIYPEVQFTLANIPTVVWYDYATNTANVGTDDLAGSLGNDIHDQDKAWGLGVKFGKPQKKGDWDFGYGFYSIGANAVVAAFNDSDFGGPGQAGFTNRVGHKLNASYLLTDNIGVAWTGFWVEPLNPSTLVATSTNEDVFRSQVDLNFKF